MVSSNPEVKYKDQKGIASSFFKFYPPEYSIAEKKKREMENSRKLISQLPFKIIYDYSFLFI